MERIFFVLALSFIFIWSSLFRQDRMMINEIEKKMDFALKTASHDVSISALEYPNVLNGSSEPVFNRSLARKILVNALKNNLYLNDDLQPQRGTFLRYPIKIVVEEYFDSSNVTFPYVYINERYNLYYTIRGPSCVFVIQTNAPNRNAVSYRGVLTSATKAEMKMKN